MPTKVDAKWFMHQAVDSLEVRRRCGDYLLLRGSRVTVYKFLPAHEVLYPPTWFLVCCKPRSSVLAVLSLSKSVRYSRLRLRS